MVEPQQQAPPQGQQNTPVVSRGELKFKETHNICAFLNSEAPGLGPYSDMMAFLCRSRIHKAISEEVCVTKTYIVNFWNTARVNRRENPTQIIANVAGKRIIITEATLRRVLAFGDAVEDKTDLNKEKVRGCLIRCGYPELRGTVYKKFFCPQFKYLAHILIHCLGSKKSGFDTMSETLQNAFAALVLNIPFNFSKMIFDYMVDSILGRKEEFLMYPRFLQLVINDQAPDLLPREGDLLAFAHMDARTVRTMGDYATNQPRPKDVKLFGHLINVDYLCPPGDKWRNEGSESESDDVVITQVSRPSTKRKGVVSEGDVQALVGEPKRRKLNLVFKERPKVAVTTETPLGTPAEPAPTTSTNQPDNIVVSSSRKTSEELSALQSAVISLLAEVEKLKAEKLEREKKDKARDEREKKAAKEIENLQRLLLKETSKNEVLEQRVKIMEDLYDEQRSKMTLDDDGYFRVKDYVTDSLNITDAGDAGTSGTGSVLK